MADKDTTPTQMTGAGLAVGYLLHGKPMEVMTKRLPELLKLTKHPNALTRVGHLDLLVAFSDIYGEVFGDMFLDSVLPCALEGLLDPVLPVNEAAFEAAQEFVSKNTQTQLQLILPMLEQGLKNEDYKIRTNYLQLVGTVCLNLVTSANFGMSIRFYGDGNSLREGELANVATKEQEDMIEAAMGTEQRNNLFAILYVMRYDPVDTVGSMAWRVWHLVVPNEKDLLQLVLPKVMSICREYLSDEKDKHKKETGRKAVGGMVNVTGEDGLHRMIPMLSEQVKAEDSSTRKAGCLAFSEVLRSADKGHIGAFLNDVIPIIRDMLCDAEHSVRVGAGHAFRQLYKNVGSKAIEKIAPYLINTMASESPSVAAVEGFCLVLDACASNTFFYLCNSAFSTLKDTKDEANTLLRTKMVEILSAFINDKVDSNVINASNVLQRYTEENPAAAKGHLRQFAAHMIKKISPYLREPVKIALIQAVYHAFGFQNGDAAASKETLMAFINDPPPGFLVPDQPGIINEEQIEELMKFLDEVTPVTQVTPLSEMKVPDEAPEPEAESDTAGAEDPADDTPKVVVKANEKQCFKCKTVKPKTKFSKKMVMKPNGICKVCS